MDIADGLSYPMAHFLIITAPSARSASHFKTLWDQPFWDRVTVYLANRCVAYPNRIRVWLVKAPYEETGSGVNDGRN